MEILVMTIMAILVLPISYLVVSQSIKDFYTSEEASSNYYTSEAIQHKFRSLNKLARK